MIASWTEMAFAISPEMVEGCGTSYSENRVEMVTIKGPLPKWQHHFVTGCWNGTHKFRRIDACNIADRLNYSPGT